jgi:hypothetical protein
MLQLLQKLQQQLGLFDRSSLACKAGTGAYDKNDKNENRDVILISAL